MTDLARRLRAAGCVFAEQEADLLSSQAQGEALEALVMRRLAGEPLETVLGWVELDGHRLAVTRGCFVPRRRTVLLIRLSIAARPSVMVELCCGVAPVAAVVARAVPGAAVHAADIDRAPLSSARRNIGSGGFVHAGDLYAALPDDLRGTVDVIAVNAPYVPTEQIALMPPEAREYEPAAALDGGADGLDLHRRVAVGAASWLRAGGELLIETSERQSPATAAMCAAAGLQVEVVHDDDLDATAVRAILPVGAAPPTAAGR